MTNQATYSVVWPLSRRAIKAVPPTEGVTGNKPLRIGFVWDYVFRGDEMFPLLQAELERDFPGSTFTSFQTFGNIHGPREKQILQELPDKLKAENIDAVILGVAN